MQKIRIITTGTPALHIKHPHYRCPFCIDSQMTKHTKGFKHSTGDIKSGQRFQFTTILSEDQVIKYREKG